MRSTAGVLVLLHVLLAVAVSPAIAQSDVDPAEVAYDVSVMDRPVVAYGPSAARLGAWLITPLLDVGRTYDSNVFATAENAESDSVNTFRPRVQLLSDWNRHAMEFEVGGDIGLYEKYSNENYHDYYFANDNTLDILTDNRIDLGLLYRHAHTPRTSSENIGESAEPLKYDQRAVRLGFQRYVGIITLGIGGQIDRITYANSEAIGGGTIDNSDRDNTQTDIGVTIGYEPFAESTAYLRIGSRDVDYDDSMKFGGYNRDSTGMTIALGAEKVMADLWVLNLDIGYAPRYYADARLEDITGGNAMTFGAELIWNPTALTSIISVANRQTYETIQEGAGGNVNTSYALNLEHQLLRSLVLTAGSGYSFSNYVGSDREDKDFDLSAGLQYFLLRMVSVTANYSYRERDSTEEGDNYDKHLAQIGLRLTF
ncbi:hypothetical protein Thiosp_01262 [Thiorhodovibrio litoralis]|nr:hypothetical protein Thiosp_01262 [Thiorhodovibrio litoralis]